MIKKIGIYILDIILFLTAWILFLPLSILNYFIVLFKARDHAKGYFRVSAVNFDKYGHKELKTLLNFCLLKKDSQFQFGDGRETISSLMGKVERASYIKRYYLRIYYWKGKYRTFTYRSFKVTDYNILGIGVNRVLQLLDNMHSIKSIEDY